MRIVKSWKSSFPSSVVVASEEGFVLAGELTKQVKAMQKQVTEYWEPMRKSTYEAYTAVNQHKKEMLDPLASAEKILKRKMSDYTMEQERIRREQEEAMRKALMAAQRMADDLVKEAERKKADMLAQVERELRQKDNDTYRRQHSVFS